MNLQIMIKIFGGILQAEVLYMAGHKLKKSRNQNVLKSKNGFKSSFLLVESGSVQFKSPISNRYCIVDERIIKIEQL